MTARKVSPVSETITAAKKRLRREILQKAEALAPEQRSAWDMDIRANLESLGAFRRANTVFCFVSTPLEVDTHAVIADMLACGRRVCVPRCLRLGEMHAYAIAGLADLVPGKYGIPEPREGCGFVPPEEIDFAVVPCVTCDAGGYRLGYGGGFYDRYLAGRSFAAAVLCRAALLCEHVPREAHDLQTDYVVTDKGVITIGR